MNPSKEAIKIAMEVMPFRYRESADYWRAVLSAAYAIDFSGQQQAMQAAQVCRDAHERKCPAAQAQAIQALEAQVKSLEEDVRVGDRISGSFFEALKRVNLTHLRVDDPGSHVVDVDKGPAN